MILNFIQASLSHQIFSSDWRLVLKSWCIRPFLTWNQLEQSICEKEITKKRSVDRPPSGNLFGLDWLSIAVSEPISIKPSSGPNLKIRWNLRQKSCIAMDTLKILSLWRIHLQNAFVKRLKSKYARDFNRWFSHLTQQWNLRTEEERIWVASSTFKNLKPERGCF